MKRSVKDDGARAKRRRMNEIEKPMTTARWLQLGCCGIRGGAVKWGVAGREAEEGGGRERCCRITQRQRGYQPIYLFRSFIRQLSSSISTTPPSSTTTTTTPAAAAAAAAASIPHAPRDRRGGAGGFRGTLAKLAQGARQNRTRGTIFRPIKQHHIISTGEAPRQNSAYPPALFRPLAPLPPPLCLSLEYLASREELAPALAA